MARLYVKLAFSGLRRRRLQAALTVAVVAAAAAALTVAHGLGRVADDPWERTFEATNGAHVTATTLGAGPDLSPLERLPGVAASSGVLPLAQTVVVRDGKRLGLLLFGVDATRPSVARPLLDTGAWPRPGGVVLERSFARFHGLAVGDRLATVGSRATLRVDGIALTSDGEPYPRSQPGRAFALRGTLELVSPDRARWGAFLGVRLDDPERTQPFMLAAFRAAAGAANLSDWKADRADAVDEARTVRVILGVYSVLLLLAGGAVLATLIGGRVLAQVRELGLLKAAGLTPMQVTRLVLLEQLALGAAGAAVGLVVGTIVTPLFVAESASLLNASQTPAVTAWTVIFVFGVVVAGVVASTLVPAHRATRRTTAALLSGPRPRFRRSRLACALAHDRLPLAAQVGARESLAQPSRVVLTALSAAVTVASVVGTLAMEASLDAGGTTATGPAPPGLPPPLWDPVDAGADDVATLRPVVYGLDVVLLVIGLSNLAAALLLGVRERVRDLGLLKAIGLTPAQVTATFLTSQTLVAVLAGIAGIPLGLGLFRLAVAVDGADAWTYPSWWSLALLVPGTAAVVLATAAPLARRAAAVRVVEALRYE